jgi:hypothetical protein
MCRRKPIYEELRPETKAGVAGSSARWNGKDANENSAFASATSDAIGKSRRSVEIAAPHGKPLGDDLGTITGTSLDKGVNFRHCFEVLSVHTHQVAFAWRKVLRVLAIIIAVFTVVSPVCAAAREKPAASMHDVGAHFAACLEAPKKAKRLNFTFHFSLTSEGQIHGQPKIGWLKFKGRSENRAHLEHELLNAFRRCFPVPLSKGMARTIPGKVYYLRFEGITKVRGAKTNGVIVGPAD